MIFNVDESNLEMIESYKQRNLYYKIFAGYLLNEVIPGSEKRKKEFINLLKSIIAYDDRFKGDEINTLKHYQKYIKINYMSHLTIMLHNCSKKWIVEKCQMCYCSQNLISYLSNVNFWKIWKLKRMFIRYKTELNTLKRCSN